MTVPKTPELWYEEVTKLSDDWSKILIGSKERRSLLKEILGKIHAEIDDDGATLRPDPYDIFAFAKYTDLNNVRAVIIGQDPYPNKHACGLSFGSLQGTIPKSFINVRKALIKQKCINDDNKIHDLRGWAYQGVVLINTSFTTLDGKTKSHINLWSKYVDLILARLVKFLDQRPGLYSTCWLLWGDEAKSKLHIIKDSQISGKNIIMEWGHPSGLAAHNQSDNPDNFENCDHFKKVIAITKSEWGIPLYWDAIDRTIECFTDGSAKPNKTCAQAKGGYAVVFTQGPVKGLTIAGSSDTTTVSSTGEHQYTNNIRAEGEAIRAALRYVTKLPDDMWDSLRIVLDCEFYKNLVTDWIPGWVEKKQPFEDKKNADLNKEIWRLYCDLLANDKTVTFEHMMSHKNKPSKDQERSKKYHRWLWNNYVDKVAEHARDYLPVEPIISYSFLNDYFGTMKDLPD